MNRHVAITALLSGVVADHDASDSAKNPIRRVVNLLQQMQKKVEGEAAKQKEVHDKYMCYCKTAGQTLQASIDGADTKLPQLASTIKETQAKKVQFEQELKDHQASRAEAKEAIAKATALREKEAATFAKASSDMKTNVAAMNKAITAIESGMGGSFLQGQSAKAVARLAIDSEDISGYDRQVLLAFLTGKSSDEYAPASGQITGILKEMEATMAKELAETVADEESSKTVFGELMAAKKKEIDANTKAIETKTVRIGQMGVEIEVMKNDLTDTEEQLMEDKDFLANTDSTCGAKEAQFEEATKMRAQELVAIAETIKFLNDDDSLELFKKTLGSSFIQVTNTADHVARTALAVVRDARSKETRDHCGIDLIALALTGKKVNFEKVIELVDKLVATLKTEQVDDNNKREYCEMQIDHTEDAVKGLARNIEDLKTLTADSEETIATTADELKALADGLKALDKDVAEQTDMRKEEHEDYVELLSTNRAAMDILGVAKNRLNKFYNPKLYKPPPKPELTEEERISENFGAPAFVQVHVHHQQQKDAPPPPPEAVSTYKKKSQESNGVMAMIDLLVADLQKEVTEAEVTEKDAQGEYEQFMREAATKRVTDSKTITNKEEAKANAEMTLQKSKDESQSKMKEIMATEQYLGNLHKECDWLMSNFDLRKEARAGEIDSLNKAKAVLAGADFSLVQTVKVGSSKALRGA